MKQIGYITTLIFLLVTCANPPGQKEDDKTAIKTAEVDTAFAEVEALIEESANYLNERDFDGDGISDYLGFEYTGGAHCCYKMQLKLSTMTDTTFYPFEMDGGYGFGMVDGSQHDHFNIADYDRDGLPEVFMEIATYNGEKYPPEPEWTKAFGFQSNYIIFDYRNGVVEVDDFNPEKHFLDSERE